MTLKKIVGAAGITVLLSSCSMTLPVSSSGPVSGPKTGSATANVILGFSFGGDCSIEKAAAAGGITQVATVKCKHMNVLGVYQSYTTTVTGE